MHNLGKRATVYWAGKKGLRLEQTGAWMQSFGRKNPKPSVLVLHVGTNDLEQCTKKELARSIAHFYEVHPEVQIVWSDILERSTYSNFGPKEQGKIDKRRRASNRYARALAARGRGRAIGHPAINRAKVQLYRPDGLHLSSEGLDTFINDLKEGLAGL